MRTVSSSRNRARNRQDITLADRCQLKHENRVIVAESCEKPTIQEEGRHAVRPALRNVGELKQQPARFNDAHAPPPGLRCLRLTRGHIPLERSPPVSFKRLLGRAPLPIPWLGS